ncbi:MAG TPA: UbiA family prenyltransferase [Conexibacter sp.]|jgi:4-hydroxybenzoate polyprenyltransferase
MRGDAVRGAAALGRPGALGAGALGRRGGLGALGAGDLGQLGALGAADLGQLGALGAAAAASATAAANGRPAGGAPPLVRLVRLPSVMTVPGDALLGAAWARNGAEEGRGAPGVLVLASSLLYLGGMALNDWADREVDARERPSRPIPAGEVAPQLALGIASGLSGAALLVAAGTGGPQALRVALPLTAAVWGYDLVAKDTAAGPWTMALARSLDVMLGAGKRPRSAAPVALLVGAHTLIVTLVSRREAEGADDARLPVGALAGVAATTAAAAALALRRRHEQPRATAAALACFALYASALGKAGVAAARRPDAPHLQRMVGAGVLGLMPLQAGLLALCGRPRAAAAIVAAWPLARRAARKAAVT